MINDEVAIRQLKTTLSNMTLPDLILFCEGTQRATTVAQMILMERDMEAWKKFDEDFKMLAITRNDVVGDKIGDKK
jgi:hypothetical protein